MGYDLNLYRGVSRFGGFRGCSIFSGICHTRVTNYKLHSIYTTRSLALRIETWGAGVDIHTVDTLSSLFQF